ncbi:hypothetical protein [Reinekea sp.]|jgi:hypothetical protein|uniref:hypothetical protein n=1 Tax=Reinekea sp. TaxID=1970455 RepID=UPI003988A5D3
MRAGRLNTLVNVTHQSGDVSSIWAEWLADVPGTVGAIESLEQPNSVTLRHRNLPPLTPGDWIEHGGRLLRIGWTGLSTKVRNGYESVCTEYAGINATYTPLVGQPKTVRIFIERDLDYIGEVGRIAETRHRIELLQIELERSPERGDLVTVGPETLTVEGLAPGIDDGILYQIVAA